ncbi:ATP-grasp domain-containing protein [Mesorhizobium sp. NZP2234]|uniref:ATP-grasp domain-containing protein n=1 Tax=Mesorhizobium sp. NZP2234 TaxID=2483402 RepID=UPI0015558FF7|nr:acetyl-CoA carboxylase biotin carboxylase subunit family protein [Mesorhizobium sp. NZP2234]QKC93260.1 ATP-grasp domain-containing protein [Mesorhizobium sp. NZP2234]
MAIRVLILIEGHNSNGPPYVQAAQRLGLHPITISADPTQYEYISAGRIESLRVDTDDLNALIRECSRLCTTYDVVGITCPTETFCVTVGKLCRYFDLPGPIPEYIERCCDKFAQRQLLAAAGVPIPAYRLVASGTDVQSSAAEIGLPVIVKPAVGRGSRGVRLCRTVDEVAEHTTYLLGGKHIWPSSPRILVEEFARGPLYSAHILGSEVIGICAADFGPLPHFVYRQFTFPAVLSDDEHERIADVSLKSLRALGLSWGPTNIELRWTKLGPVVIEVNPRLAGALDSNLVQLAYGVDLAAEHVKLVIGEESDLRRSHSLSAATRILIADRDGTVDSIDGESRAAAVPGVVDVKFEIEPKTSIVMKGDHRDCIGYVMAVSPSHAETEVALQRAVDLMSWSITPFPKLGG